MINVEKLSYGFPQKDLYDKVSFTIEEGQHVALIGSNGTGKTTLADMLIHTEDYLYDGKIKKKEIHRMGYVSQFVVHDKDRELSVYDFLAEDFLRKQAEMEEICMQMETAEDVEKAYEAYQNAVDEFDAIDGYNYDTNIHKQLKVAGLTDLTDTSVAVLSGGEFKLIQIIRQMLLLPGLLVMDEPDAFLDFENLTGLSSLINAYKGTLLVITHNRYLLNHCFNKILHLENKDVQEFEGNFTDYNLALLQMKVELQEQAHTDQEFIDKQQALVDKLRESATNVASSSRGKTLKARVSYLERLEARKIKAPFVALREPQIRLPELKKETLSEEEDTAPGNDTSVLEVNDYGVSFKDLLLEHVSFKLGKKDKVAIVGPNGTGKTTLLRDIYFRKNPAIHIADDVKVAFLSQLYSEMLDEDKTIYQIFDALGFVNESQVAEFLKGYYFEAEDLVKKTGQLSGGEKNLLQLAMISLSDADLLLFDEPTSHLDTYAQIALEKAIADYKGAVLMVCHDFYTITGAADRILYVEDKSFREMSARAFRKMIYKNHFNKDYLELEQNKKQLELKIEAYLKNNDFEKARTICEHLDELVKKMNQMPK